MKPAAVSMHLIIGAAKSRATIHELAAPTREIATIEGPHPWVLSGVLSILEHHVATPKEVSGA